MTDDGLKTLAWCIFWGLTVHGCMSIQGAPIITPMVHSEEVD